MIHTFVHCNCHFVMYVLHSVTELEVPTLTINVQCSWQARFTLYSIHYSLCSVQCTVYTAQWTLNSVHCIVYSRCIHYITCVLVQYTLCSTSRNPRPTDGIYYTTHILFFPLALLSPSSQIFPCTPLLSNFQSIYQILILHCFHPNPYSFLHELSRNPHPTDGICSL